MWFPGSGTTGLQRSSLPTVFPGGTVGIPAGSRRVWTFGGVRCGHRDLGSRIWLAPRPVLHLNLARWATHDTLAGGVDLAQSKDFSGFKGLGGFYTMPLGFACLHAYPLGHWGPISPACEGSINLLKSALLWDTIMFCMPESKHGVHCLQTDLNQRGQDSRSHAYPLATRAQPPITASSAAGSREDARNAASAKVTQSCGALSAVLSCGMFACVLKIA